MFTEKRGHKRHHVLKSARIILPGGNSTLPCIVLDLSTGGAKLRTDQWFLMPDQFSLDIDGGATFMATLQYRYKDEVGIHFQHAA